MSNSLVCGNCGTPNRANAKFCIGCAGRLPGLAPAGTVPAHMPAMQAFEHDRPIPASRPEPSPTSFWLHLSLVGLTMIFAFVAWCVYVLHGRTAPWSQREQTPPVAEAREVTPAPVVPTPAPAPEPAKTAAVEPKHNAPVEQTAPDAVTQALALSQRQTSQPPTQAAPRQAAATERPQPTARPAPTTRTASAPTRARRDAREVEDSPPVEYPIAARRPGSQPDPGPPVVQGPGPQYSWTLPTAPRATADPGPPIAVGPGPRYESRPEVRAPVAPSGDTGPPIAVGPGPRYDYSTPPARER